jgi:pimeloyl-ACP methyl ester carboxylesterase
MPDLGGKWIRQTPGDTCVIFIHGILSDGEQAWMNGNGNFWPQLLADNAPFDDLGIYAFSYRSDAFCRTYSLKDVVDSLRENFNFDDLWTKRHIVFVGHSMGGIIARRFIVTHQTKLIQNKTEIGLFLVASPSLGSKDANALFFIGRLGQNSQAAALRFSQSNIWLNDLHDEFRTLKESGTLPIKGKELVEDETITLKKLFGLRRQIVEPWSAATYFGEPFKIPRSNHSSIAKPKDADEPQCKALTHFLKQMRMGEMPGARKSEVANALIFIHLSEELQKLNLDFTLLHMRDGKDEVKDSGPILNEEIPFRALDSRGTLEANVIYTKRLGFQFKCFVSQGRYDYDTILQLLKANRFTEIAKGAGPNFRIYFILPEYDTYKTTDDLLNNYFYPS